MNPLVFVFPHLILHSISYIDYINHSFHKLLQSSSTLRGRTTKKPGRFGRWAGKAQWSNLLYEMANCTWPCTESGKSNVTSSAAGNEGCGYMTACSRGLLSAIVQL